MFSNLINRNNTSFPKQLYEVLKSIEKDKGDVLRYHQRIVVDYLLNYDIRGILAYQKMGSGKTIIAVSCAVELLIRKYNIIFLSSKSLHNNFKDDIKKYHSLSEDFKNTYPNVDEFIDKVKFVSMNASNMLKQLETLEEIGLRDLENTFLIIDEAHNLFNSIVNESKNALGLYDMIMKTKNIKLLFLTGSPIVNHPFEIALCFNMLAGSFGQATLFSTDYNQFNKYFITDPESSNEYSESLNIPKIKNADKFSDRIFGLVSYYGADNPEQLSFFPKKYKSIINLVNMSSKQFALYVSARTKEIKETERKGKKSKSKFGKPKGLSSSYRVNSRQLSNFIYPEHAMKETNIGGKTKMERFPDKLQEEDFKKLEKYSPKMLKMLKNISMHTADNILPEFKPSGKDMEKIIKKRTEINGEKWELGIGKGLIYSQFLTSGLTPIGLCLEAYGFTRIYDDKDILKYMKLDSSKKMGSYVVITGDVDVEMRSKLIDMYNSVENVDGSIITLMLVSSTGAEGIDLKAVRHTHLFEPYWNYSRILQFVFRAVRYKSHVQLPEKERTVQPYIYLSDYPKEHDDMENEKTREKTTDIQLYYSSIKNQMLIDSFYKIMRESSIDCMMHYSEENCRMCAPTGKILWRVKSNDMDIPSPCEPLIKTKITAKSIISNGKEYMYHIDNGVHIFEYRKEIDSYKEIYADHDDYDDLYEAIVKKEKI